MTGLKQVLPTHKDVSSYLFTDMESPMTSWVCGSQPEIKHLMARVQILQPGFTWHILVKEKNAIGKLCRDILRTKTRWSISLEISILSVIKPQNPKTPKPQELFLCFKYKEIINK